MSAIERAQPAAPALAGPPGFDLFGPPPLLAVENRGAYDRLLARVAADLGPHDAMEMMWVKDIVDLIWEVLRYRRFRAVIIDAARHDALDATARSLAIGCGDDPGDGERLSDHAGGRWLSDPAAKSEVLHILGAHGMSEETIAAEAFLRRGDDIERIEKLLISAERRRDAVLREIAAYREVFAARARVAAERIIDAQPLDIAAPLPATAAE
jgi:hypothetical protein